MESPPNLPLRPQARPWRMGLLRLLGHLGAALVIQVAVLLYLDSVHWIGPVLPWDDIAYAERAMHNLEWLRGWRPTFSFHAPLADLQTMVGMELSGLDVRAAYFLNFVHLAAATLFVDYFFRGQGAPVRISLCVAILAFAPMFMVAGQLKSDYKGGLYLWIALMLLFEPGGEGLAPWRRTLLIAGLMLLSLFAKMTAIYMPLVVLGIVGLHAIVNHGWKFYRQPRELRFHGGLVGLVALGYGIVLAVQWEHLAWYVRWALSDKWSDPRYSGLSHLLYYTPFGETGRYWGAHALLALFFGAWAWRMLPAGRGRRSLLAVAVVAAVLWLPLLRDWNHNVDFGGHFYFAVLGLFTLGVREVMGVRAEPVPTWALLAIPLGLVLALRSPLTVRREMGHLEGSTAPLQQLVDAIHARGGQRVTFLFDSLVLPHPNVSLMHRWRHGRSLAMGRVDAFEDVMPTLDQAGLLVALDAVEFPGMVELPQWTANVRREETLELLDGDARAQLVGTFPVHTGALRLYAVEGAQ